MVGGGGNGAEKIHSDDVRSEAGCTAEPGSGTNVVHHTAASIHHNTSHHIHTGTGNEMDDTTTRHLPPDNYRPPPGNYHRGHLPWLRLWDRVIVMGLV